MSTAPPPEGARTAVPHHPMEEALARLAAVIESRLPAHGSDPDKSYVARLLHRGPDAFLKKIGEEATEVALAHYGFSPRDVVAELERRAGTSGIEEKALRKAQDREASND
jgi:phosphoribosyl-ATP pyrophosphohydrolase